MTARTALSCLALVAVAALASYGLATAGEPQSVWLWRDVLGVTL